MFASFAERAPDALARIERAEHLADHIDRLSVDAEQTLNVAAAARRDQQLAWIVLRDRGWPSEKQIQSFSLEHVRGWLLAWSDLVALPIRIVRPQESIRFRLICRVLERWELQLRASLPAAVWRFIDPLDQTGRATLACLLQALVAWVDASAHWDVVSRQKERLAVCFSLYTHHSRALGLAVPAAPLDVDAWRGVAEAARSLAATERRTLAA